MTHHQLVSTLSVIYLLLYYDLDKVLYWTVSSDAWEMALNDSLRKAQRSGSMLLFIEGGEVIQTCHLQTEQLVFITEASSLAKLENAGGGGISR